MKKLVSIFLLSYIFYCLPMAAQWENAQLSEVPSQTGTAIHAKGAINSSNTSFIAWQNNIGNLYFASRDAGGNWSLPELVSDNVITESADIINRNEVTYISYLKTNGADTEIWLAEIAAPFTIVSNEMVLGNTLAKTSLSLGIDSQGIAHLSWAMEDTVDDLIRVYYYNNSTNGQILGATRVPLSNMKDSYNPVDICVTSDGKAEITYVGAYINDKIIQRTFNNDLNSTSWNYGTYFDYGPSGFTALETTMDENLVYYAAQQTNGAIVFFQAHSLMTDAWIPENGNATVITTEGTLESVMITSSVNRHCSIISDANELVYAYNTSDSNWETETLLNDGAYSSGDLSHDSTGELYWMGIKDGKAVMFAPETTTGIPTLADFGLNLYPNPASDVVYVEADKPDNYSLKIYDIQGRLITSETFVKKWMNNNVSRWQRGIYFIQIEVDKQVITQKLVIN